MDVYTCVVWDVCLFSMALLYILIIPVTYTDVRTRTILLNRLEPVSEPT